MFVFDSVHPTASGGRRQVYRRGFTSKKEAQDALDEARRQDRAHEPRRGDELTVADVFADFVRAKRLAGKAPNTVAQYEWAAGIAGARWGGWPAESLTSELLDGAYEEMLRSGRRQHRGKSGTTATGRPMSARSVEAFHKTLKAAFQLAVDKGRLSRNPAALATPPAVSEQARRWWTPEQVGAFLAYVAERPCVTVALGETLVDTGGRRGEVLGLRWEDLDLDAGTATVAQQLVADTGTKQLTIRSTKRPRSRSVIGLHPDTIAALRRRKSQQAEDRLLMGRGWPAKGSVDHGLVFTWGDGRAIHPDVLTRTVERMSVAAGLPRLTPHGLRHSFATAALSARVPIEVVAARLGNTPRMVQEVYQHVIPADDQAAARLVGDLYRKTNSAEL
jgi:integrase